jgi:hypothetical protein
VSADDQTLSSPPVTILVSSNSVADTPHVFTGTHGSSTYVINALGELRVFGETCDQFGLSRNDNMKFPQLAAWPEGVKKWMAINSGGPSASFNAVFTTWALNESGELYMYGTNKIPFPSGVTRWIDLYGGMASVLLVGDDGMTYENGAHQLQFAIQGIPWKRAGFSEAIRGGYDSGIIGSLVVTLARDGRAFQHGYGSHGEPVSVMVPFPAGVTQWISMGLGWFEAVLMDERHQLYRVPLGVSFSPVATLVSLPDGVTEWREFSAGALHVLAIGNNGQLYAWGRNWEGQLGIGSAGTGTSTPVVVPLPQSAISWKAIAAGHYHSVALASDCSVYTWGDNSWGQLGIGPALSQTVPTRVSNLRALCGAPVVYAEGEATLLADASVRVQFTSELNRLYWVQYSDNLTDWITCFPLLNGTGGTLEWIDDGPPKTERHPTTARQRLYRLVYAD